MYQAVRDPRSNLHFNACLSSIITSGTAWLNFTDAYRALASRRPSSSRTTPPSRLYTTTLILLPPSPPPGSFYLYLYLSISLPFPSYLSLACTRGPRFIPSSPRSPVEKNRGQIYADVALITLYMYKICICTISESCITFLNSIMIGVRQLSHYFYF